VVLSLTGGMFALRWPKTSGFGHDPTKGKKGKNSNLHADISLLEN